MFRFVIKFLATCTAIDAHFASPTFAQITGQIFLEAMPTIVCFFIVVVHLDTAVELYCANKWAHIIGSVK